MTTATKTRCAFCGKPKRLPKDTKYAGRLQHERDPYCSRRCCEQAQAKAEA